MDTIDTEMTCQELVQLVTDYFEGTLSPTDRERFEAHLPNCRGCRNYLEQMRQTIRTVGRLSEETINSQARDTLLARFRDWKRGPAPRA
ncbi:MAG: zf-HC2 domain-containing protein [Anaerolineae bacterium]